MHRCGWKEKYNMKQEFHDKVVKPVILTGVVVLALKLSENFIKFGLMMDKVLSIAMDKTIRAHLGN